MVNLYKNVINFLKPRTKNLQKVHEENKKINMTAKIAVNKILATGIDPIDAYMQSCEMRSNNENSIDKEIRVVLLNVVKNKSNGA